MQHLDEGTIHAWLDGQLPRDEAGQVEAHVAECRECADAVAEARGLIAASSRILLALDGVPGDVAPKTAISHQPSAISSKGAEAATQTTRPATERARRRWFNAPSLAAAATIVVAVGSLTLMRFGAKDQLMSEPQAVRLEQTAASAGDTSVVVGSPRAPTAMPAPAVAAGNTPGVANEVRTSDETAPPRAFADGARRETAQPARPPVASLEPPSSAASARAGVSADSAAVSMQQSIGNARAATLSRAAPVQLTPTESKDQTSAGAQQRDEQMRKVKQQVVAAPAPPRKPDTVTVFRGREVAAQRFEPDDARRDAAKAADAVAATGVVRGRVTDGNNTALATVLITVAGTNVGVTTTESGQFELRGVPLGTQRVLARRIGFNASTQEVTVTTGQATTLDFRLTATPANLESVVVTGAAPSVTRRMPSGSAIARAAPAPAADQQAQSATAVGCYDLSITPATPQSRSGFRQVPRRIALDSTIVPARTDGVWYQVRDLAGAAGTAGNGVWRPTTPDGLEAQWTYGSRTGTLRLTGVPGPVLRGSLEEIDRASGVGEAGVAVAAKVRCGG